jgi:hypothetical protein
MVASNQFVTTDFEPFFFNFVHQDTGIVLFNSTSPMISLRSTTLYTVHPQSKTRGQNVLRPYYTNLLHEQLDEF